MCLCCWLKPARRTVRCWGLWDRCNANVVYVEACVNCSSFKANADCNSLNESSLIGVLIPGVGDQQTY